MLLLVSQRVPTAMRAAHPDETCDEQLAANIRDIYKQVMQHPLDHGFYEGRRANWAKINVSLLSVTTWGDDRQPSPRQR
jgi:hypothetical protein